MRKQQGDQNNILRLYTIRSVMDRSIIMYWGIRKADKCSALPVPE